MEDLIDYMTLEEYLLQKLTSNNIDHEKIKTLCDWLIHIYSSGFKVNKELDILSKIYFSDIFNSLSKLLKLSNKNQNYRDSLKNIVSLVNNIYKKATLKDLYPHYNCLMHGDLNTRNIMIKIVNGNLELKLIDIDKLSLYGDYVFDIGELLVDIEAKLGNNFDQITQIIEKRFREFANYHNDNNFEKRLKLSKARSYIKLAKIFMKSNEISKVNYYLDRTQKILEEIL